MFSKGIKNIIWGGNKIICFWSRTGLIWIGQNNFLEDRINLDWTENFRTYSDRTEYIGIGLDKFG